MCHYYPDNNIMGHDYRQSLVIIGYYLLEGTNGTLGYLTKTLTAGEGDT